MIVYNGVMATVYISVLRFGKSQIEHNSIATVEFEMSIIMLDISGRKPIIHLFICF